MSFKTIVEAIVAFFKAIFGGKKSTSVQPVKEAYRMKEDVIQVLVQGHPYDEQAKIREYIRMQEEKGFYNYVFETSRSKVTVRSTSGHGAQFYTGPKEQEGTSY